jgi:hypothetical protein
MFLKRIVGGAVFVAVLLSSGCLGWHDSCCERQCSQCHQPYAGYFGPSQQQCCVPCCCQAAPATGCGPGPAPANYGPSSTWTRPAPAGGCCQQ